VNAPEIVYQGHPVPFVFQTVSSTEHLLFCTISAVVKITCNANCCFVFAQQFFLFEVGDHALAIRAAAISRQEYATFVSCQAKMRSIFAAIRQSH
jgi:hypothetical protein